MKTLKIQIEFTHQAPNVRRDLRQEIEDVCENYRAEIEYEEDYIL